MEIYPNALDNWKEGEEIAVATLQTKVQDLGTKICSDISLLRQFLIANDFDETLAATKLRAMLDWRKRYQPELIKKQDVQNENSFGKLFLHGEDIQGRLCEKNLIYSPLYIHCLNLIFVKIACFVIYPGKNTTGVKSALERWEALVIYWLEKARKKMKGTVRQFVIILDKKGFTRKNLEWALLKKLVILQDYYPESIANIFVVRSNILFECVWKVSKSFLDPHTLAKISIFGSSFKKDLSQFFTPENLLKEHGGTSLYKFGSSEFDNDSSEEEEPNPKHRAPHYIKTLESKLLKDIRSSGQFSEFEVMEMQASLSESSVSSIEREDTDEEKGGRINKSTSSSFDAL